jgi:hypothetical protein
LHNVGRVSVAPPGKKDGAFVYSSASSAKLASQCPPL